MDLHYESLPLLYLGILAGSPGNAGGYIPHGPLPKVYVNKAGLASTRPPANLGTLIVKESYDEGEKLLALTVMYKPEGYNSAAGDWFGAKYNTAGKVAKASKPTGCICWHGGFADTDYILTHSFD